MGVRRITLTLLRVRGSMVPLPTAQIAVRGFRENVGDTRSVVGRWVEFPIRRSSPVMTLAAFLRNKGASPNVRRAASQLAPQLRCGNP